MSSSKSRKRKQTVEVAEGLAAAADAAAVHPSKQKDAARKDAAPAKEKKQKIKGSKKSARVEDSPKEPEQEPLLFLEELIATGGEAQQNDAAAAKEKSTSSKKKNKKKTTNNTKTKSKETKQNEEVVEEEPITEDPEHIKEHKNVSSWSSASTSSAKKGVRFSAKEHQILEEKLRNYLNDNGVAFEDLGKYLFKNTHSQRGKWEEIGSCLPERSLISVYWYVKKHFTGLKKGPWDKDELTQLQTLVEQHGPKWSKIAEVINRDIHACRDKWRDTKGFADKKLGSWTSEERTLLEEQVKKHIKENNGSEKGIPWSAVVIKIPGRSHTQCRQEWQRMRLHEQLADNPEPLWPSETERRLTDIVFNLGVEDETEIQWSKVAESLGDRWTGEMCRHRWYQLKNRYVKKKFGDKGSFDDIVKEIQAGLPELLDLAAL